jgi:hypothetical protein
VLDGAHQRNGTRLVRRHGDRDAGRAALATGTRGTHRDHAQTCGCADVDDLVNRIDMAHAAIDKYRAELGGMGSHNEHKIRATWHLHRID